jgi:hypothetical protein
MSNLAQLLDTVARLQSKAVQIDDLHRTVMVKNGGSGEQFRTHPDAGQASQANTSELDKILVRRLPEGYLFCFEYYSTALLTLINIYSLCHSFHHCIHRWARITLCLLTQEPPPLVPTR